MEISIDEKQVQDALNEQATTGVKNAFQGYAIKSVIEKTIAESVIPTIITDAMTQAASSIDTERLVRCLSEEMARSITKGVQHIMRETMVGIVLDIKKIPTYDSKQREEERQKILISFDREA